MINLNGSLSNGGSTSNGTNSASNYANSWSQTYANAANQWSAEQAELAYNRTRQLQREAMEFNAKEAQKARDYNTEMANTIYTRSVKNMIEAGINPILAANAGLSAASVGSGQSASISGTSSPMAQSFMDTSSASSAAGESYGENHGSSWQHSESGLATGLQLLGNAIAGAIDKINGSREIKIAMDGLGNVTNNYHYAKEYEGADENGKPKKGYTGQYDSDKKKYLTTGEVEEENFLDGLYRGFRNMTNAHLGISGNQR